MYNLSVTPQHRRPLDVEVLNRLEERLRADGARPIDEASNGSSADELRDLTAAFPGEIPAEAELWWTWRTWGQGWTLPDTQYLPLDAAMQEYEWRRGWASTEGLSPLSPEIGADDWWQPLWLPLFVIDSGIVLAVDAAESDGATASIREIDWQGFGGSSFARVLAQSLGDYIANKLDAIDAGEYVQWVRVALLLVNSSKQCSKDGAVDMLPESRLRAPTCADARRWSRSCPSPYFT
jgi:hypothetical protein